MKQSWGFTLAVVLAVGAGCREKSEAKESQLREVAATRQHNLAARMAKAGDSTTSVPLALWVMPPELREISGLVLTSTGTILAHDDEVGRIYEIDPKSGIILKRFTLNGAPHGDFEAIAIAGNDIYLLQSNGKIYRFAAGGDGQQVPYAVFDTRLGRECEFEGLAFEADSSRLVMACKKAMGKARKNNLVIYRVPLPLNNQSRPTMLEIPMARVVGANTWKAFEASDITVDPTTGNYVLLASHEKGIAVITPAGDVVRAEPLPSGHNQAEGIAITRDGILIISDEATQTPAHITLYRWRP